MSWLGVKPFKKWPGPILRPMAPFFAAGLVVGYAVIKAQDAMMKSDEWKNDPRSPYAKRGSGGGH